MHKVLLIDKPKDWTSFDVVAKIRSFYSKQENKKVRVGHAGTLDPFATGLLIILVGQATKEQDKFMKLDKEYEATLRLGCESSTGDTEGEIKEVSGGASIPSIEEIEAILKKFQGKIKQVPPAHSAIKIRGRKAYELARSGKRVKLDPREITIYKIEVLDYRYPILRIKTKVSSGTYIRSLARDIGWELGCGAYLTDLKRTKIGKFSLKEAQKISEFNDNGESSA